MKTPLRLLAAIVFAFIESLPASGQVPSPLRQSFFDPSTALQAGAQLGSRVAVEGRYAVVGVPLDDSGGDYSGIVKVFDSTSGKLLFILRNPVVGGAFGSAVAISGSRVAVGAPGAPIGDGEGDASGAVYVFDLSRRNPTAPVATLPNPISEDDPDAEDADFGTSVGISGSRVAVGQYVYEPNTNIGHAYVFDLNSPTPAAPAITLENIAAARTDSTRTTVAISGFRVVVGVTLDDSQDDGGPPGAGRAYVYDLSSSTPAVALAAFREPGLAGDDAFGSAVAISGTRVVVGNSQHAMVLGQDTYRSQTGIAYVYDLTRNDPTIPLATLQNPLLRLHDGFGSSLAISGTRVVVGAPYDHYEGNGTTTPAGFAYLFDLGSATPATPVRTFNNPFPALADSFGFALAISETRILIGAPGDDTAAPDAGSAYLYDNSSTIPLVALASPGPATGAHFGTSLAISGTLMVVGAPNDDTGGDGSGRAYVYDLGRGAKVPVFTLNNPGQSAEEGFGAAVSIDGRRVVVGAPRGRSPLISPSGVPGFLWPLGKIYVYDLASSTPTVPQVVLNNPNARGSSPGFGSSIAISGTRVVAGAPWNYITGSQVFGTVSAYDLGSATPTVPVAQINNPGSIYTRDFGNSVSISGTRFVVGVLGGGTPNTPGGGSAYVFNLASANPTVAEFFIDNPSPDYGDAFGSSVAISEARVVVGDAGNNSTTSGAGSAFVFNLNSSTPTVPVVILNNPTREYSGFAETVAISGTRIVVGAAYGRTGAVHGGKAYAYDLASRIPRFPIARLQNPRPAEGDGFGISVAIDGSTIAAGTPNDDTAGRDNGAAYSFGLVSRLHFPLRRSY